MNAIQARPAVIPLIPVGINRKLGDMTDSSPASEDLAQEGNWTPIEEIDEVWSGPTELPPSLADPRPPLLNTHEMGWESFERLILAMARTIDEAFEARRYGKPGQSQQGLDVVAFHHGRAPSVYQAKHWQTFLASDLESAVRGYLDGKRPFEAARIVLAVASEVRDAKTIKMLADLNNKYADISIEVWDRQFISDCLRSELNLVRTFFGDATAAAFCVRAASSPSATPSEPSITADAILRGPVAHLQLTDDLAEAERRLAKEPAEAAQAFGRIAQRLESEGFLPHAVSVRELQAKGLSAAGEREAEAWLRLAVGWRQLAAGDELSAVMQVREVAKWGDDATEQIVRCTNALGAVAGFRHEYAITLDDLAQAFDELRPDDPHRADVAVIFAEEAVAARRSRFVEDRRATLGHIAETLPRDDARQLISARLRMAIADSTGDWEELARVAREMYPPQVVALISARHARHLALVPNPAAAVARWRDAIERACVEGANDDAADWLYSVRAIRVQTGIGLMDGDINELHRHALALRAAGNGTVLPEPYRGRERALAHLRAEKWPDALSALRRYLWRSVVGADWGGEIDAHDLLGDLFSQTDRAHLAVEHYIAAGKSKKLEAVAAQLGDEPIHLPIRFVTPRPWERTAAFSFAAAAADLMVDADGAEWCTAAFQEISDHSQPAPFGAPDPWLAAFKAFGRLAMLSTEDQALRFLEMSRNLIPRAANRYRLTDEPHIDALIGIARAHASLKEESVDQFLLALLVDQRMADRVLSLDGDMLRAYASKTAALVGDAAAEGNYFAALALIVAGGDTSKATKVARARCDAATAPRVHTPGLQTFGTGLARSAALVTALPEGARVAFARAMLEFAADAEETAQNRVEALVALEVIAGGIPDDVREELFDRVLPIAKGEYEESVGSGILPDPSDPLSRFRIDLGSRSLAPSALKTAATLARRPDRYAQVEQVGVAQLRHADDAATNSIAAALALVPAAQLSLPVDVHATHPNQWMRALAAVVWTQRPDLDEGIGAELARDPSRHVRLSLARSLSSGTHHDRCRAILSVDPRRSLRTEISQRSV